MRVFVDRILDALRDATGLPPEELRLEQPRDAALGDVAFPCFPLARARKAAPPKIAAELAAELAPRLADVSVESAGPYLNFRIDRAALAAEVTGAVRREGARYGCSDEGGGATVVIDFSSPNIAKPMHVGHLRSTILGAAIQRLHDARGYRTVGINHIGDWGAQFGGLVAAIRRWRDTVDLEAEPVAGLLELYRRSKQALEEDEDFKRESVAAYQELESGEEGEVRDLWRWATEVSLRGFDATYRRLGIRHDLVRGESFYEPLIEPALARVEAAGVTEVSRGALVVQLGEVDAGLEKTPCLLRQTNGTTLYATRDLAALFQRWEEFRFARCLYVVGAEQKLHFRQLKAVLRRMGCPWEADVEHVDFGLLLGPGRVKIAARRGELFLLDDLLDEVVAEALRIIEGKNPGLAHKERVAEQVGVGALVFNDLKRERIRDVIFDKGEILAFEGETGPYVQYTHARLASILRKAAEAGEGSAAPDWSALGEAGAILLALGRYPDAVGAAARACEPSLVAQHLLALCRDVSSWYSRERVLGQEGPATAARLALVESAKIVIGNGLQLLGLAAPEEM